MMNLKRIAVISMAVIAASATAAPAGTKYATNLVSNSAFDPPPNPTLSPKSQIKLSDKGSIQIGLAGVTDAGGTLVTTSTVYNDNDLPTLDGTEYTVIIKLVLPAISGLFPVVEVPLAFDLKNGKGKAKINVSSLFALIPPGSGRTVEIIGSEVWGPLGPANAPACQAVLSGPLPVGLPLGTTCRGGTQFGMSGLAIPPPAP